MKHVTLLPEDQRGEPGFVLLGPSGRMAPFDAFFRSLRKAPFNTKHTYALGMARFFDYFIEAAVVFAGDANTDLLTREQVVEVLEAYDEYLVYGAQSGNEIAKAVAAKNPSPMVSQETSELLHAPLRKFLKLSEGARQQMAQLAAAGLSAQPVSEEPLIEKHKVALTHFQKSAMQSSSMLASVIADGPRLLEVALLRTSAGRASQDETDEEQAFPFDLVQQLIGQMPSHRDKAIYSLCAACGCRPAEALQILWEDIDLKRRTIRLVSPRRRANHPSYLSLSTQERKKYLTWKARNTQQTLLIEPFATILFDELEAYRRQEWKWSVGHDFVFQHVAPRYLGRPFVLSSRSTRSEAFAGALARARVATADARLDRVYSPYSLRHTYAFYLLNYFPRKDGTYGLPLAFVKQLMGHKLIKSTMVYARIDRDLAEEDIAVANAHMFGERSAKDITAVKREILLARLAALERDGLADQQVGRD